MRFLIMNLLATFRRDKTLVDIPFQRFLPWFLVLVWLMPGKGNAESEKFCLTVEVEGFYINKEQSQVRINGKIFEMGQADPKKGLEAEMDTEYEVEFIGEVPEYSFSASLQVTIGCCFAIEIQDDEGNWPSPGEEQKREVTLTTSPNYDDEENPRWEPEKYTIRIVKPRDLGEGSAIPSGCGCPIKCDGGGGEGARSLGSTPPDTNPQVDFSFSLGRDPSGRPSGTLYYKQPLGTSTLSRHDIDFRDLSSTGITKVDGGGLRQVKGSGGFVDIVPLTGEGFELRFYELNDVIDPVDPNDPNELYTFSGNPVVVHRLEDGDDTVTGLGVDYSVTRDGVTTNQGFYGNSTVNGSVVRELHADGKITETTTLLTVDPVDSSIWTRVIQTRELQDDNGVEIVLSERHEEYASRPWDEVLERTIDDPNGAALTTEYAYYENPAQDGSYTKTKHVIYPNGSWVKYDYNIDGQLVRQYRPWKDLPAHPDSATANNCWSEDIAYDSQSRPNSRQEYILDQPVKWRLTDQYYDYEYDGTQWLDVVKVTESIVDFHQNQWSWSSALDKQSIYFLEGSSQFARQGRLFRTVSSDGNVTTYLTQRGSYNEGTGDFTEGAGSYTRNTVTRGTLTAIDGVANKTTREETIFDDRGSLRRQEQVYTGTGYEKTSESTYEYESGLQRRLIATIEDGDVVSNVVYTSPTQTTETDAYGIETTQTFDSGGRLIQSVKTGVAAMGNYQEQSVVTTNYEQNGLTTTTTVSAGTLSLSNSSTRDLAGRIVSRTDEEGRTTLRSYTSGGRVITETDPGNIARITTHYLDGSVKSITGNGSVPEFHNYTVDTNGDITHTVYYGSGDDTSPRWKKTVTNGLGQVIREERPGPNGSPMVIEHMFDEVSGQRLKTTRTGYADTLYVYDELGRLFRQGSDLNVNGSLDLLSADSITESDRYYEKDLNDDWWEVSVSRRYLTDNDDEDVAENVTRRKLGTGAGAVIEMTEADGNSTLSVTTVDRPNKTVTTTTTSNLSNVSAVLVQVNGLLVSQSSLTVSAPVLLRYDALGRQAQWIDPRTNQAITTVYNASGQVVSVTDGEGNATTYTYYGSTHANAGLLATQTNQESETTHYAYDTLGRITHQWGNGIYPLSYTYNGYGDTTQLRTYRASGDWANTTLPASFGSATPSVTTWGYHAGSGLQTSKTDDSSEAVSYTYHDSGLLATRTWARGVNTSYTYDTAGRLTGVDYADSTPDVTYTYRRDGQRMTSVDAAGSHVYTYHEGIGHPAAEAVTGGLLDGLALTWGVDGSNRPNGYSATLSAAPLSAVSYGYDATSRLNQVSSGVQSAEYGYVANSDLLHTTTLKDNTITRLTGTRMYDDASRLGSIAWTNSAAVTVSSHSYTYDGANRRLRADLADGSYWEYSYNDKGEVISGVKKNAGGTAYPGLNHGYTFDEIGNRLTSTVDAEAGGNRSTGYTSNGLNQYTSINHPSAFDVTGSAVDTSIVKVNTLSAQRLGPYFRKELLADNVGQPAWESVSIEVTLPGAGAGGGDIVTTRNGHRYIAPLPEAPSHDEDGNLVSDGRWLYTWDGENRLIAMETTPAAIAIGVPKRKLEFAYDGGSRRIRKQVYDWDSGTSSWTLNSERRFIYERWNLMAEVDGSGNLLKNHVWGLDLSQTMQGAGGVGGLLWSTDHTGSSSQSHFATYDGNGNVTALVEASSGNRDARYDYDAFGRTALVEGDALAESNSYRFSTKYEDPETELYYYGFRYYSPELGRWPSRDPLAEKGFSSHLRPIAANGSLGFDANLYAFPKNDSLNFFDFLGLEAGDEYDDKQDAIDAALKECFDKTKESVEAGKKQYDKIKGKEVLGPKRGNDYVVIKKWAGRGMEDFMIFGVEHGSYVYSIVEKGGAVKYSYNTLIRGVIPSDLEIERRHINGKTTFETWNPEKHVHNNHKPRGKNDKRACLPAAIVHSHNFETSPANRSDPDHSEFSGKDGGDGDIPFSEKETKRFGYTIHIWLIDRKGNTKKWPEN